MPHNLPCCFVFLWQESEEADSLSQPLLSPSWKMLETILVKTKQLMKSAVRQQHLTPKWIHVQTSPNEGVREFLQSVYFVIGLCRVCGGKRPSCLQFTLRTLGRWVGP